MLIPPYLRTADDLKGAVAAKRAARNACRNQPKKEALLKRFKSFHEHLTPLLTFVILVCSICGFIYLFAYTRFVGIPFPLELSVLPTTLLMIGAISLTGTLIIAFGILVPGFMADDASSELNLYLLGSHTAENQNTPWFRFRRYIRSSWIPMTLALFGAFLAAGGFGRGWGQQIFSVIAISIATLWILAASKLVPTVEEKRLEYFMASLMQTFMSVFAYFLSMLLLLLFYPQLGQEEAWLVCGFLWIAFSVLHWLVTTPTRISLDRDERALADSSAPSVSATSSPTQFKIVKGSRVALVCAGFIVFLSVVIYPVNAKIGMVALSAFRVGGGTPLSLCLKEQPAEEIGKALNTGMGKCTGRLVSLLDAGDRMYVAKNIPREGGHADNEAPAVSTHSSKDAAGRSSGCRQGALPPDSQPIYIRQDQVLQKIYLPEEKNDCKPPSAGKPQNQQNGKAPSSIGSAPNAPSS